MQSDIIVLIKLIWNIDLTLIQFTHCYFISFFFCVKNIFYSKNIHYASNLYGTDLYVSVCRDVFRTQKNICGGVSLWKLQKSLIVDIWMGSNYTSGTTFIIERFPECQYLYYIANMNFVRVIKKFIYDHLVSWTNKKHFGWRRCNLFSGFLLQLNGLMLYCKPWTILEHCCNVFTA